MAPGILEYPAADLLATQSVESITKKSYFQKFDPVKHLAYVPPKKIHTLEDLCLPPSPISPIASTDPFPLLSEEALLEHRRELLSDEVLNNCMYSTREQSVQLRGMAPRYAPFIHQFWTSPEVLKIVSELAGVDLVPVMDFEICHTNVQLGPDGLSGVRNIPIIPPGAPEQDTRSAVHAEPRESPVVTKKSIVPWHRDSYPFVCVVMLSDARHMEGGETEIQRGDGRTIKVRSPQMGGAMVLQGRHVSHIARPVDNMPERITIVASFRPRYSVLLDDSSLMNVRNKSRLSEMYYQWTSYRLHLLAERFRLEAEKLDAAYRKAVEDTDQGRPGDCKVDVVDVENLEKWMEKQMRYMRRTMFEMRPVTEDDNITKNEIEEV
ncbi:uncharacterized protein Z520_09417 [Fonsecaea multimorphosa CBS 102226]|uniref:Fe2OG dioxygenase domain-containing protein n=1 Tax=Fonsecaea multimorphosa CBS 102226 TaxID=1442371 RepID=A0A0D2JN05_9EURO|nr:uncharacterized protein Z520_09417 [Fonsecaea multimorphosa CBS 102226]KIX94727.1 hypothetical protein Z520_09417 [Fonsecaea multimorphosa CBS 102226]OAL20501.1 hypothetical protein AYO22_08802 [Fonsecaea multimorphosa]